MCQVVEGNYTVWVKEATHRAANLEQIAVGLPAAHRSRAASCGWFTRNHQASQRNGKDLPEPAHAGHL